MKAAYLAGGILIGFGAAYVALEARFRKEYDEKAKSLHETYEFVKSLNHNEVAYGTEQSYELEDAIASMESEPQEDNVRHLESVKVHDISVVEESIFPGGEIQVQPETTNYHKAVKAVETPVEQFVSGGVNDYGVSYIEEEEYQEDDGRAKEQIVIMMDEHNPLFLQDGVPIDDWDQKVGDSIIVDFYRLVPPGVEPVLYVRNHRTDVDYEVVRAEP